jgi:integrase
MLFDRDGNRKYMVGEEWQRFMATANARDPETRSFCWTLAMTGARVSEAVSLTSRSFDLPAWVIRIRTLKRRKLVYREIPLDDYVFSVVEDALDITGRRADPFRIDTRLWPWCRTTAWSRVKSVGLEAGLPIHLCTPKALRHSMAFEGANTKDLPLGLVKELLGHARLESTLEYTTPVGEHARELTDRIFRAERLALKPVSPPD